MPRIFGATLPSRARFALGDGKGRLRLVPEAKRDGAPSSVSVLLHAPGGLSRRVEITLGARGTKGETRLES